MGKGPHPQTHLESSSSPSPTQNQEEIDLVDNYTLDPIVYINQLPPIPEGESPEFKQTKGMFKCFSHFLFNLGKKSYADQKRKPMEFEVRDRVILKVSPWKWVMRFGKRGKLNLRYVKPFKVLARFGKVAYKLELPQELSRVYHTFHVSNLKKCYADEPLVMPLEGIHVDDKLQFVEEPVEIMEREIK
ncbi:hypothetical protein Tco_0414138 [Tanacetum coccineum]